MSDKATLIAMLTRAHIGFTVSGDFGDLIRLTAQDEGVIGYSNFFCDIAFDSDGNLSVIGIWE